MNNKPIDMLNFKELTELKQSFNSNTFTASILLNNPYFTIDEETEKLIASSNFILVADGAANSLVDRKLISIIQKINFVIGDFDSIKSETIDQLLKINSNIKFQREFCQDTTDLQKCLMLINKEKEKLCGDSNITNKYILTFGTSGGRVDHSCATVHASIDSDSMLTEFNIVNISTNTYSYMLIREENYRMKFAKQVEGCFVVFNDDTKEDNKVLLVVNNSKKEEFLLSEKKFYYEEFNYLEESNDNTLDIHKKKEQCIILCLKIK